MSASSLLLPVNVAATVTGDPQEVLLREALAIVRKANPSYATTRKVFAVIGCVLVAGLFVEMGLLEPTASSRTTCVPISVEEEEKHCTTQRIANPYQVGGLVLTAIACAGSFLACLIGFEDANNPFSVLTSEEQDKVDALHEGAPYEDEKPLSEIEADLSSRLQMLIYQFNAARDAKSHAANAQIRERAERRDSVAVAPFDLEAQADAAAARVLVTTPSPF